MRKISRYIKTKGTKTHFKNTYYNDKKCFKYLLFFGIWYLVTLLIILRFLGEVMPPTTKLVNVFRVFFAAGILFTVWSGYQYLSERSVHRTYYVSRSKKAKYLVTGIVLAFVILAASAYTDISPLEPVRNLLHLEQKGILEQKEIYHTKDAKEVAACVLNCVDSTVIWDTKYNTYKIDITVKEVEHCHIVFEVLRSDYPSLVGKSMKCDCYSYDEALTLSEFVYHPIMGNFFDPAGLKYCEGSFKEEYWRQMEQFAGWWN